MRKCEQNKQNENGQGRRSRWREDEARSALTEWKRSGLSAESFASSRSISPTRLSYWSKRLGEETARSGKKIKFVPLSLKTTREVSDGVGQIEIIRDGVILRVREDLDADHVARLVSALARGGSRC